MRNRTLVVIELAPNKEPKKIVLAQENLDGRREEENFHFQTPKQKL